MIAPISCREGQFLSHFYTIYTTIISCCEQNSIDTLEDVLDIKRCHPFGRRISDLCGDGLNVLLQHLLCNASVSNQLRNLTRLNSSNLFKVSTFQSERSDTTNPLHFRTEPGTLCTFRSLRDLASPAQLIFYFLLKIERERGRRTKVENNNIQ